MTHKKHVAVRPSAKPVIHPVKPWGGGIETTSGPAPTNNSISISTSTLTSTLTSTQDVRLLCVAVTYPYMFENPLGALSIERHWATAFTLTCREIDACLGKDKRGFHWRQFDIEDGQPHWYWALGPEYDHTVWLKEPLSDPTISIAKSPDDPQDELRIAIRTLVASGMRRAAFFNQEAGNPGEQP